jgi:hypothetical protein
MPNTGDWLQAETVARKIARDISMGFGASGSELRALLDLVGNASPSASAKNRVREIELNGDTLSNMEMLMLQELMQNENRIYHALSSIMKMMADTRRSTINNIR